MSACSPIRQLRETFNLSQMEVAGALGIAQPIYSMIETGKTTVDDVRFFEVWKKILELGFDRGVAYTLTASELAKAAIEGVQ